MGLFFSPAFAYPYLWLICLAGSLAWLLLRLVSAARGKQWWNGLAKTAPAVFLFGVLSGPLWFNSAVEEFQCRQAGLDLPETIIGQNLSVFWRSHAPHPDHYSAGLPPLHISTGQEAMNDLVRALVESRLLFFEIPYEPRAQGQDEKEVINQKIYLAHEQDPQADCLPKNYQLTNRLPAGTCLAWETSRGIQSAYELKGTAFQSDVGHTAEIRERSNDRLVAKYQYLVFDRGETALYRFGLKKLPSPSCRPEFGNGKPAGKLVSMAFGSPENAPVKPDALDAYDKSPWRPVVPLIPAERVPKGQEGIDYQLAKGVLRRLTGADSVLWAKALGEHPQAPSRPVPDNAYLVTGPMRFPLDVRSAVWVLPENQSMPSGPLGANTVLRVGQGCIWAPGGCRR